MLRKLSPARRAGSDSSIVRGGGRLQANARTGLVTTFQMDTPIKLWLRTVLAALYICRDARDKAIWSAVGGLDRTVRSKVFPLAPATAREFWQMTTPLTDPDCNVERRWPTKTASWKHQHHPGEHMSA